MALMSEEEVFADLKGSVGESCSQIQRAQVALLSMMYRDQKMRLGMQRRTSREIQMRDLYQARQRAAELATLEAAARAEQTTDGDAAAGDEPMEEAAAAAKAAYEEARALDEETIIRLKAQSNGIVAKVRDRSARLAAHITAEEAKLKAVREGVPPSEGAPPVVGEVPLERTEAAVDPEIEALERRVAASLTKIASHREKIEDRQVRGALEEAAVTQLRGIHAVEYKARRSILTEEDAQRARVLYACRDQAQHVNRPPSPTQEELEATEDRVLTAMAKHKQAILDAEALVALKKQPELNDYTPRDPPLDATPSLPPLA
eukprot:TRINITY_DN30166_c0_g1_i1.p1 TRINITY_DN30166_c0_g1~~TRINITY_DN30166_c0_g1_i1.p1  ORF type:complete len:318 (+),score=111.14 TRINITY_DN30166_c0_g1_i1:75-1028(+)